MYHVYYEYRVSILHILHLDIGPVHLDIGPVH